MNDDEAAIHAALAIGHLEIIRYYECKANPKGPRARAVRDLIDRSLKIVDLYRLEAFSAEKEAKASRVLDEVEKIVNANFGLDVVG